MKNTFSFRRTLLFRYSDLPQFLHKKDDGTGGGGGGNPAPAQRENPADVAARYSGDAIRMAAKISELEGDNFDYREKLRLANAALETANAKVPAEGTVVLSKEQATQWEAFQKLGKPEEVTKLIDDGKAAIATNAQRDKAETLVEAAKLAGMKPGILKLVGKDLDIKINEVDVKGEDDKFVKAKQPFVVRKAADGTESTVALTEYFKAQGEDVLATLMDDGQGGGNGDGGQSYSGGGVQFPAQQSGGEKKTQNQSYAAGYVQNRYAHNLPKKEGQ